MVSKTFTFPYSNFIGFDHLLNEIDRMSNASDASFPRHNVVKFSDNEFAIELALAGYKKEDLSIEMKEGNLTVSGNSSAGVDYEYLHKGISSKKFTRTFKLAEHILVDSADFVDGILSIFLRLEIPEEKLPKTISIGNGPKQLLTENANG